MTDVAPPADISSKQRWEFGKTIVDGVPQFGSVSGLELAQLCLRRWVFAYGHGIKEGESDSLERGNEGHEQLEIHLKTGRRDHLGSLVIQGMHQVPAPGDDLLIEYPFVQVEQLPPDASKEIQQAAVRRALDSALLRADNIPILGKMDLVHERPENVGVQDINDAVDAPGVLKIRDWKFPGSMTSQTVKTGPQLLETLQMAGYGRWGFLRFPHLERIRLEHAYFPVKGDPAVSTILAEREQADLTWKRADAIGVSIRHAAREVADPNNVEANVNSCRAFGRDCPAKVAGVCRALDQDPLSFLIGGTAADRLLAPYPEPGELVDMTDTIAPNSLVAQLRAKRAAQANTPAAAPAPSVPPAGILTTLQQQPAAIAAPAPALTPPPAPVGPSPDEVRAAMVRLQAEEAAAAAPPPAPEMTLEQLISAIEACGFGFPRLDGAIANAVMELAGVERPAGSPAIDGNGEYAPHTVNTHDDLKAVLVDAQTNAAQRDAALTPDTKTPPAEDDEAAKKAKADAKKAKAEAKKAEKAAAAAAQTPATPTPAASPTADDVIASQQATMDVVFAAMPHKSAATIEAMKPAAGAINVYVDCAIEGLQLKPLATIIDELTNRMNASSRTAEQKEAWDFRLADKNSNYGFGGWRGILTAAILETPMITPGDYVFNGSYGDIGGVVVEAIAKRVRASGGVFVKGSR